MAVLPAPRDDSLLFSADPIRAMIAIEAGFDKLGGGDMKPHRLVIILTFLIAAICPAQAQTSVCGSAPQMEDLHIRADLDGKASFVSKYVGDTGLKGQVEIAKNDVLQKYPRR